MNIEKEIDLLFQINIIEQAKLREQALKIYKELKEIEKKSKKLNIKLYEEANDLIKDINNTSNGMLLEAYIESKYDTVDQVFIDDLEN